MDEKMMVNLLLQRDPAGMEALLRHYGPLMRYIVSPILPDPREREECLSDAAMRVWEKIGTYDPDRGGWVSWLSTLTRNAALNRARRASSGDELPEETCAENSDPETLVLRTEQIQRLRAALNTLSDRDRALFYRKYYYLQPAAQIAAELGTTVRAVEGRLYRIRRRLQMSLGGEAHG